MTDNYITRIAERNVTMDLASGKVLIILGARQVGKTTLIKHALKDQKVYAFNFDIDIDRRRFLAASTLEPEKAMVTLSNPDYIIIDEAQRLAETTKIVKGWYDSGVPVKLVLLGSSSLQIIDSVAESLAGRNRKLILPTLTFYEIIRDQSWSRGLSPEQVQQQFSAQLDTLLLHCMAFGHYPEVVLSTDKRSYLNNLSSDILWKDLLQLGAVKTPDQIGRLLTLLAHQVGSEVSVNELSNATGLARPTIERYLNLLEQIFIIFKLPAFSRNPRKEISKSQKYYFWDTGIRNALLNTFSDNPFRPDIGALWENWVVAEFARQNMLSGQKKNMYFWRSKAGSEIDLILQQDEQLLAYEIKWNPKKKSGRAFSHAYGVPIQLIHRHTPLFFIDNSLIL